jgi:hypothetical protein
MTMRSVQRFPPGTPSAAVAEDQEAAGAVAAAEGRGGRGAVVADTGTNLFPALLSLPNFIMC